MRKIKNYKLILSSILLKSRRAVKGSISLFLAWIVTPLLGMTLLMIESIRYQDIIEEMIEINDLSAFATLANYDKFLKDRFGLLATSQDEKLTEQFEKYFYENVDLIDQDILIRSFDIDGEYSLQDVEVLKQQLLEFSQFSALFDTVFEGLDISEFLKQLSKYLGTNNYDKLAKRLDYSGEIFKSLADVCKTASEAQEYIEKDYTESLNAYNAAYEEFEEKLNAYIEVLNEYDEDDTDIYNKDDVKKAWKEFAEVYNSPKSKYKRACSDLSKKITELNGKIEKIVDDIKKISSNAEKLTSSYDGDDDESWAAFDFAISSVDLLITHLDSFTTANYSEYATAASSELHDMSDTVGKLKKNSFDYDSSTDDTKATYYVEIPSAIKNIVNVIQKLIEEVEGMDVETSKEDALEKLDLLVELLDIPCMIDGNLKAIIDFELNEQIIPDNNDRATWVGLFAIVEYTDCIKTFTFPINPFDVFFSVYEITLATTALVCAFTQWVENTLINSLIWGFTPPHELYNHYLLSGYGAYNFPNRTNYMKKLDLTEYKYGTKMYNEVCGQDLTNPSFMDNWEAMDSISLFQMHLNLEKKGYFFPGANSDTFYGAGSEYLLCGVKNEVYNQCGAFYNILMLRLCLNLVPLFKDQNVKSEAACAGPYAWIIYILVLLGDSFIDTFILVNGGDIYFIKFKCYLTKDGLQDLWKDLCECSDATKKFKNVYNACDKYMNGKKDDKSKPFENGLFPHSSYTDHMFLCLLLCTHEDKLLDRIQNSVFNEAYAYYDYHNDMKFKMGKTYTYIHSDIVYEINPMFSFTSLTNSRAVHKKVSLERYIGY